MVDSSPAAAASAPAAASTPPKPGSGSGDGGGPASLIARHPGAAFDIDREVLRRREQLEERERETERRGSDGVSTAAGGDTRCVQYGGRWAVEGPN